MPFLKRGRLAPDANTGRYPFTLPIVRELERPGGLDLDPAVTFLVGDNGIGKSTLAEAILRWGTRKPRTGFLLPGCRTVSRGTCCSDQPKPRAVLRMRTSSALGSLISRCSVP